MNGVQLLLIVVGGIAVSGLAHRRGVQPGLVIVVLAAAASFIPGVPRLELDRELILAVVVPPLLYSATRGASMSGFAANLRPILALGVGLVLLTTAVTGFVASWLLPAIGLPAAFVLGAVVAPPDTITTVSHGDEIGLPRRATAILTGESLVNDATALTLFSLAAAAAGGEHTVVGNAFGLFGYSVVVGILVGGLLAVGTLWLRKRLRNATLETALALLVPFTAFLAAEQLHASGVLAVVVAAFSVSVNSTFDGRHQTPESYRTRLQEEAFWPVVDFLLETFVFAYIGLQLRFVIDDLIEARKLAVTTVAAVIVLLTVIAVRLVAVYASFGRWRLMERWGASVLARSARLRARQTRRDQRRAGRAVLHAPTAKETLVVGWTGMRGIVTLAAAAAVPAGVLGRDAIQAVALFVTLGTLLLQGTTVTTLVRLLRIDVAAELHEAEDLLTRGNRIATDALSGAVASSDVDFEAQRAALSHAVAARELDDRTARELIHEIDLRQAAHEITA